MAKKTTVPVTEKALYQRINRKLRDDGETLKRARGAAWTTLGEYYVVNLERNYVSQHHVDLEEYGRELGALQPFESVQINTEGK
jgi:hypothetical protein